MSVYVSVEDGKPLSKKMPIRDDIVVREFRLKESHRILGKRVTKSLVWIGRIWFHKKKLDWITSSMPDFRRTSQKAPYEAAVKFPEYNLSPEEIATMIRERVVKDLTRLKIKYESESKIVDIGW